MISGKNFIYNGSVKADRIIIGLSAIGLIAAAILLLSPDFYSRFVDGSSHDDTSKPLMGTITEQVNDTRFKSSQKFVWVNAKKKQNIRSGDSLFSGENSRSRVLLKDGNEMVLGENTMIVFTEKEIMDLNTGNFRLRFNGKITLSIQGNVTTVEGDNSDIQFIVPKEKGAKPQVRLLGGTANLQVQGNVQQVLAPQQVEVLPMFMTEETARNIASALNEEPISQPEVAPPPEQRYLRLYDVFELKQDNSLARRTILSEEARDLQPLNEKMMLSSSQHELLILDKEAVQVRLSADGPLDMQGYVYEISTDKEFPAEQTRASWASDSNVVFQLTTPGKFFYRVRGVNQKTELTFASDAVEVLVSRQQKVAPLVEVKSARKNIESAKISEPLLAQKTQPIPEPIPRPSVVTNSLEQIAPLEKLNQNYASSRIDFETGLFTVLSPDEMDVGRANPYAYMLGLRSKHWFTERSGFEGIARIKAGDVNKTANGINPLSLEARYHYKLSPAWVGRTNFSLLTGFEMYRNIGRGYFAQKYDLGKVGFALDFPVGSRWDAGGDLIFGMGSDQTKKYEALGRLNYYFRREYSAGVGYRLYLLDAGSAGTAPLDFPYKETWGEGFFVFRWHY